MDEAVKKYISEARKRQMSDATIRENLRTAGWSADIVSEALPEDSLEIPMPAVSVSKEVWMYVVSAFLPPFGLIWVRKYFKLRTEQGQRIGFLIIGITILSLIVNIWIIASLYQDYFELLSSLTDLSY